ncbi:hypothetical protein [Microbacterium sp. P5_E9]
MSQPFAGRTAVSTRNGRIAFVLGGSLLIAASLVEFVRAALPWDALGIQVQGLVYYFPPMIGAGLFGASLLVFAWGVRGEGSVVARKAVGLTAMTVLGLWNFVLLLVGPPLLEANPGENLVSLLILIGLPVLLPIVVIIAVVSIGRARAIPGLWRWAPAIAICPYLILYVTSIMSNTGAYMLLMDFPFQAVLWADIVAHLLLGVLAIGLAVAAGRRAARAETPPSDSFAITPADPSAPAV